MNNVWVGNGRLTKDPELRYTKDGTPVLSITIATDRDYVGRDGVRPVDFIPVTIWANLGEFVAKYFSKGDGIEIVGRIETDRYVKDGETRHSWGVRAEKAYFPDKRSKSSTPQPTDDEPTGSAIDIDIDDGDVPF